MEFNKYKLLITSLWLCVHPVVALYYFQLRKSSIAASAGLKLWLVYTHSNSFHACMDGFHTRCMTLQWETMTTLNARLPLSNTIMYNFRRRPGGPSGERLRFISDRDITFTLSQGDQTVTLAAPAQSQALPSKATVMNRRLFKFDVPACPLCSRA